MVQAVPTALLLEHEPEAPTRGDRLADNAGTMMCAACMESFGNAEDFRVHSKSDRHVYNTKRKLSNLKPISQEAWDRKLREARAAAEKQSKGTAHLKGSKEKDRRSKESGSEVEAPSRTQSASSAAVEEGPPSPRRCLFDRKHFETIEECLSYMAKQYSFFVPDIEYCTDVAGLLLFLREKMEEPPHRCICCNRPFQDLASLRRHMLDKCHTHLSSEVMTRRGFTDKEGTDLMHAELSDFFNFQSSVKEVMQRMTIPQRVAALLRYFDQDGDGLLNQEELRAMWAAAEGGAELSEELYLAACAKVKARPEEGVDTAALQSLYAAGVASLDAHFLILEELLSQARPTQQKFTVSGRLDVQADVADDDDLPPLVEEDAESDGEGDASDSEFDIVECEDEDEFDEVMRVLGLEPVDITDAGDLRLPNGAVASHRSVSYIFRQRGQRLTTDQIAAHRSARRALGDRKAQLMLSNAPGNGSSQTTQRQAKREGKKVVAMLRHQSSMEVKLAMKQGVLQTNRIMKTRSVRGDASGAGGGGR